MAKLSCQVYTGCWACGYSEANGHCHYAREMQCEAAETLEETLCVEDTTLLPRCKGQSCPCTCTFGLATPTTWLCITRADLRLVYFTPCSYKRHGNSRVFLQRISLYLGSLTGRTAFPSTGCTVPTALCGKGRVWPSDPRVISCVRLGVATGLTNKLAFHKFLVNFMCHSQLVYLPLLHPKPL